MTRAVIILGMHRSGTSCLTGCLEQAGLEVGDVDRKTHTNPKGNRENRAIMDLNNAVLADHGATWDNPPVRPLVWGADRKAERDRLIATYPTDRPWGFKEPRTLLTLAGWREALPDAALVASVRHPVSVALSLQARNGFAVDKGLSLWRHYNAILLKLCQSAPVALISFDGDVAEYAAQFERVLAHIGLPGAADVTSFFEPGLRRNPIPLDAQLPPEIDALYKALLARVVEPKEGPSRLAKPLATQDAQRHIPAHSMRLFPKRQGPRAYRMTGMAARCDWVLLSDPGTRDTHLHETIKTDHPRHIFLSLRHANAALAAFHAEVLPRLTQPFVLVSGSEDVTLPVQLDTRFEAYDAAATRAIAAILEHPNLTHWFAENLADDSHPKMSPLPTGMVYANGAQPEEIADPAPPALITRPLTAFCAHRIREGAQWAPRRKASALATTDWAEWCAVPDGELSEADFPQEVETHSFVLCVEGGGLDPSPKAWQSILHGAIPIIRETGTRHAYRRLPVAFVPEWDADSLDLARLQAMRKRLLPFYDDPILRAQVLLRLGQDYWWNKVADMAR